MTRPDRIPTYTRDYPDWVSEALSDRQLDALPPPMLWAKVVQRYMELSSGAVTVALGMALRAPVKGSTFAAGIRWLADDLHRSKQYVSDGLDELEQTGFVQVHNGGPGRPHRYTLTLPTVRPVGHIESGGVRTEGHIESNGQGVSGEKDKVSLTADAPSLTADALVLESGHIERRERLRALSSAHAAHADADAPKGAPRSVRKTHPDQPARDPEGWGRASDEAHRLFREYVNIPYESEEGEEIIHQLEVACYETDWSHSTWDSWEPETRDQWTVLVACDPVLGSGYSHTAVTLMSNGWDTFEAIRRAATDLHSELDLVRERVTA